MTDFVRISNGFAVVTDDEHGSECSDCYSLAAKELTAEQAVIAAEQLLALAGKAWTGLRDVSPPRILTDEQDAAIDGVEAFVSLSDPEDRRGNIFIPLFSGPFDIPGVRAEIVFGPGRLTEATRELAARLPPDEPFELIVGASCKRCGGSGKSPKYGDAVNCGVCGGTGGDPGPAAPVLTLRVSLYAGEPGAAGSVELAWLDVPRTPDQWFVDQVGGACNMQRLVFETWEGSEERLHVARVAAATPWKGPTHCAVALDGRLLPGFTRKLDDYERETLTLEAGRLST